MFRLFSSPVQLCLRILNKTSGGASSLNKAIVLTESSNERLSLQFRASLLRKQSCGIYCCRTGGGDAYLIQGYLNHKKQQPPRTAHLQDPTVGLCLGPYGGPGKVLMSEVPLYTTHVLLGDRIADCTSSNRAFYSMCVLSRAVNSTRVCWTRAGHVRGSVGHTPRTARRCCWGTGQQTARP